MEEKMFILMHRDDPICAITIDTVSGAILRVGKPTEIAEAALFLASDKASFITGDVINVSGGFVI